MDDEIAAVYAANLGLRERLDEMEAKLERGELHLRDGADIRQRARELAARLGEPLDDL